VYGASRLGIPPEVNVLGTLIRGLSVHRLRSGAKAQGRGTAITVVGR
jgi:hypothetical protein